MKTCVLIPSYNEEKTIGGIIRGLKTRDVAVYVVDDGSTDNTYAIAVSEGANVVRHAKNMGKGASLREGFRHVLAREADAILVMDGDDQHEIDSIDDFIRKMEETDADMVIGNRMPDTLPMPLIRRLTNHFMSWLISVICGQRIPDSQCGFRLIKRAVLEKVSLSSSNFEIESELIIKASRAGFRIESVPIRTVYQDEMSRINPVVDTIRFIIFLIKTTFSK